MFVLTYIPLSNSATLKYTGIPIIKLNGNVTPILDINAIVALAFGSATWTAAGAAIYEALAHKTPRIVEPPIYMPIAVPAKTPRTPIINGNKRPKTIKGFPTFRTSEKLNPAK